MGDYNLDLLNCDSHAPTSDFVNNFMSHSFFPTIHLPTRITETSSTLIDNIFSNNMQHSMKTAIIYGDISDHLPVVMHIDLKLRKNKPDVSRTKRVYSLASIEQFKLALTDIVWDDVVNAYMCDPNLAYNIFLDKFSVI